MAPAPSEDTWVLLRGLVRESRHWGEFPAQLAAVQPGATILCPDLPGNGMRHGEKSASRVSAMVDQIRGGLADAGHRPPYRLLALSLGGMIAIDWSQRFPDEVRTMVLINTSMRPFSPFYSRLRPQNYPAMIRSALGTPDPVHRETAILRLVSNDEQRRRHALPAWSALAREHPVSRFNALRQLAAAARFRAHANPPAAPVLVLASTRDRLVSVSCSRALARRWRAELREHPAAGHDMPLDDGPWVAAEIERWLAMRNASRSVRSSG